VLLQLAGFGSVHGIFNARGPSLLSGFNYKLIYILACIYFGMFGCLVVGWLTSLRTDTKKLTRLQLRWEATDLVAVVQMLWKVFRAEDDQARQ
jgi:hypothetical protein